jgi:hypothetical protein
MWRKALLSGLLMGWVLMSGGTAMAYKWKYNPGTQHWYAVSQATGWVAAEAEAVAQGGHLVTINDADEDAWVKQTFVFNALTYFYIGFYQPPGSPEPAGGWTWSSGEPVIYTNWGLGEPNNNNQGPSAAIIMDSNWNDTFQTLSLRGIIERATQPTPHAYDWKYNPATGHWYALTSSVDTWTGCEEEAVQQGGHLVTINDEAEQAWLIQPEVFGDTEFLWIGFYQPPGSPEPDGGWVWSSGEPVTYTGWDGPEPNNAGFFDDEYCVLMNVRWDTGEPHWVDYHGNLYYRGIIERTSSPSVKSSLPAMFLLLGD